MSQTASGHFVEKLQKYFENMPEKGAGNSATWLMVRMECSKPN